MRIFRCNVLQHLFSLNSQLTIVRVPALIAHQRCDDFSLLHALFNHAHVFRTRVIGEVCDIDQERFHIREERLGWKLCFHLSVAAQHYVFIQQATRECLVVSNVDLFVAVGDWKRF